MLGLSKRITANANQMTKDAARAFIDSVVDDTPVDTGLMVSSWKVGLNYQPSGTRIFAPGKLGSTASTNREAVKAAIYPYIDRRVTGQTISFTNDTPYLQYVNDGDYARYVTKARQRAYDAAKQRKLLE